MIANYPQLRPCDQSEWIGGKQYATSTPKTPARVPQTSHPRSDPAIIHIDAPIQSDGMWTYAIGSVKRHRSAGDKVERIAVSVPTRSKSSEPAPSAITRGVFEPPGRSSSSSYYANTRELAPPPWIEVVKYHDDVERMTLLTTFKEAVPVHIQGSVEETRPHVDASTDRAASSTLLTVDVK